MCQHNNKGKLCLGCKLDKAIETGKNIARESSSIRDLLRTKKYDKADIERKTSKPRVSDGDLSDSIAGNS